MWREKKTPFPEMSSKPMPLLHLTLTALLALFLVYVPAAHANLFVASETGGTINQFSNSGQNLGVFASGLNEPLTVAPDQAGNLYVAVFGASQLDKFSLSGTLLWSIALGYAPGDAIVGSDGSIYVVKYFANGTGYIYKYSSTGQSEGVFATYPAARGDYLAFDAQGNLYVSDYTNL